MTIKQATSWLSQPGIVAMIHDPTTKRALRVAVKALERLPSAQPKTGKWISADAIFGGVPFYCSECGESTLDTVMGKPRYNFCPMCGAKMGGADDE